MTKRISALFLMVLSCAVLEAGIPSDAAAEDDVLYCSSVDSVGFVKKDGRWETANFTESRFTLKVITTGKEITIEKSDLPGLLWDCKSHLDGGVLFCQHLFGASLNLNRLIGKYVYAQGSGWLSTEEKADDVGITIGKCESF